ncbi:MAG: N-6 DNA methylase [Polyangiaceae bacterium]|nr:N-6 DNA methylase [Polyangiaceae bacterium]
MIDGCLLPAVGAPSDSRTAAHWTDKGDWLALAKEVGAREVFFVGNEPVLVLAELPDGEDEAAFYNRVWSMARPEFLFLASDGLLRVYALSAPPVKEGETLDGGERLLVLAQGVRDIVSKLAQFRRESVETGQIYGDERFGTKVERADRSLVQDFKQVRRRLTEGPQKLAPPVAHKLIARALFLRYLEDRGILTPSYFEEVAKDNPVWQRLLAEDPKEPFISSNIAKVLFFRVLRDKDFTYALFAKLTTDFNGDTFPVTAEEHTRVKSHHLLLLRRLLVGDGASEQLRLFFYAYRFDIIPIELISSIYEDFYTAEHGKDSAQSSYYTPPALVDFLLSRALPRAILDNRPCVMDAACGSGIFLVETFRRMVRHRVGIQRKKLSQRELRVILRDQIRGIDLNPEAVPIAAFSLYLAYLHYQKPREIDANRRLPNLRWDPERKERDPDQHFDILFEGNAFDAIEHKHPVVKRHFGPESTDCVVGNPPWGAPKKDDIRGRAALSRTLAWCNEKSERAIGDQEMSQAFVHLALALLKDGGTAGLLLSSGVLFKQHDQSRLFRTSWLGRCKLNHVVNFAHVRHLYFAEPSAGHAEGSTTKKRKKAPARENEGASPFISAVFSKGVPAAEHRFAYWCARRITQVEKTRAIVLNHADQHWLNQQQCAHYDSLWKIYWWGGRRDEGLIRSLERFPGFISLSDTDREIVPGQGFKEANKKDDADWLSDYRELPAKKFTRYSPIAESDLLPVPSKVERRGVRDVYEGSRLLLNRGVGVDGVVARLETENFCFRHSIQGFRLKGFEPWQERIILGVFWSALAKYYFWLTAGSWGMWHDELHLHFAGRIPIAFPHDPALRSRIVATVDKLRDAPSNGRSIADLEAKLDEAIFDLYELNDADRDLVRDMCDVGLDFFYERAQSAAVLPTKLPKTHYGLASDLPNGRDNGLTGYLQVFLHHWNADLGPDGELAWEVIAGPGTAPVLAALFSTVPRGERPTPTAAGRTNAWNEVLRHIAEAALVPEDAHHTIYTDTFIRAVGAHEILIIKRNEMRLWTRSAALADADATVAQAMRHATRTTRFDRIMSDDDPFDRSGDGSR